MKKTIRQKVGRVPYVILGFALLLAMSVGANGLQGWWSLFHVVTLASVFLIVDSVIVGTYRYGQIDGIRQCNVRLGGGEWDDDE